STAPQISSMDLNNGSGATDNSVDGDVTCETYAGLLAGTGAIAGFCDNVTIVFNEVMDASSINASLIPGTYLSLATGDRGHVASLTGTNLITVTGLVTGAVTSASNDTFVTGQIAMLSEVDSTGSETQTLTIYGIDATLGADIVMSGPLTACTGIATYAKDINGTALSTTCTIGSTDGNF
ncbi:MAG: hypothetical protein ABH856_03505, partial [Patescibacteria group bacterium]